MRNTVLKFLACCFATASISAQTIDSTLVETVTTSKSKIIRQNTMLSLGIGSSVANADLEDAQFDLNMLVGFKQRLGSNFMLGLEYNKFNIVFKDIYNEGYMSFDLNLEYLFCPDRKFTPSVFIGPGLNAANGFENSEFKFQTGFGLEYLVSHNIGLKLQVDRSFLSSDDSLDAFEAGAGNDAYYRISFGTNIYLSLGGNKAEKSDEPGFIDSNPIEY